VTFQLVGVLLARAIRIHQLAHHVFRDAQDVIALIFSLRAERRIE